MDEDDAMAEQEREAADPQTSEDRLDALATESRLRPLVAANPNTSLETLLKLAIDYPHEFLSNASLPLHILAQPDLPARLPEVALAKILHMPDIPHLYIQAARQHKSKMIQDILVDHVALVGTACADWEQRATQRLRKRGTQLAAPKRDAKQEQDLFQGFLAMRGVAPWVLAVLARHQALGIRACIAIHAETPAPLLNALANDGEEKVQRVAMNNRNTTRDVALRRHAMSNYARLHPDETYAPELLVEWAEYPSNWVRRFVAAQPQTPPETLDAMAQAPDVHIHRALAGNPATPLATLRALMETTQDRYVKEAVAAHPALPHELLEAWSYDATCQVGSARNPTITAAIAARLAAGGVPQVLAALASNPHVPLPILRALLLEQHLIDDADIEQALLRQSLPAALLTMDDTRPSYRRLVARHPCTPPQVLRSLSKDPALQAAVAGNPITPPDLLMSLVSVQLPQIQRALAQNPALPHDALSQLAMTRDKRVQLVLLQREGLPADVAVRIGAASQHTEQGDWLAISRLFYLTFACAVCRQPAMPDDVKASYVRGVLASVEPYHHWLWRLGLLSSSFTPAQELIKGAASYDWLDRYAVVRHDATPDETLRMLAENDTNRIVRAAASATLASRAQSASPPSASPPIADTPTPDAVLAALRFADVAPEMWQAAIQSRNTLLRDARRDHVLTPQRHHDDGESAALAQLAQRPLTFGKESRNKSYLYYLWNHFRVVPELPVWFTTFCATHPLPWLRQLAAEERDHRDVFYNEWGSAEDRAYTLNRLRMVMHEKRFPIPDEREALLFRYSDMPQPIVIKAFDILLAEVPIFDQWFRRFTVLSSLRMLPEVLDAQSASPDWTDRYAIARNPQTPLATRQCLAERDGNRHVRAAAR